MCIGISIVPGGIMIQRSEIDGRETGECFVELASRNDVDKALARDRNEIQHRYVKNCMFHYCSLELYEATFTGFLS